MADYSIGDRVEVRWQTGLFDAAVIHVHSPGTVDAVYDIDGSVGIFLTAKEHGLKSLGMRKRSGEGRRTRCVCWVAALFKPTATKGSSVRNMAANRARSVAAPPRRKHGGCASNTAQMASVCAKVAPPPR